MLKRLLFTITLLISFITISCSEKYEEVSQNEFLKTVLPEVKIKRVQIENNEKILIETYENFNYRIEINNSNDAQEFITLLEKSNQNFEIVYSHTSTEVNIKLFIYQTLVLLIPILIIAHVILLWIALRKIIKSETDSLEKILCAMISIFFPFFGPLIYLTTERKSSI